MAQAESNRVSLHFFEETAWDETPSSPAMTDIPYTSESLKYEKRSVKSNIVRSDRLTDDIIEVGAGSMGDINLEYKFTDFEKFIQGALGSVFQTGTFTGVAGNLDIDAAIGNNQALNAPASTWVNFTVGGWVRVSGATGANNGVFQVFSITSTVLTIINPAGVLQANADGATVITKWIRTGTTKKSFLIEKAFNDIAQFIYYRGMRVSTWAMNVEAEQIITGSFGFMGARAVAQGATISGSIVPAAGLSVCGATSNVGTLQENATALTTKIKSVKFNLNANPRSLTAVANKYPIGINYGSFEITGTIEAYFEDLVLYNKFINHNDSSLTVEIKSPEDDRTIITIKNLKFTNAEPVGAGLNQDVMVALDFTAKRDTVSGSMMQVDCLT